MRKIVISFMIVFATVSGCTSTSRPKRTPEELLAMRKAQDAAKEAETRELMGKLVARAESKMVAKSSPTTTQSTTQPTIDVLVISGGGDWGAFGAGVLKGWGTVKGEMARPQFDVVTGVSTGALIAPFAFLGDDASIERVVHLYRHPKNDWTASRGLMYFLPNNPSFYVLPGLERELKSALDRPLIQRLVEEGASGRILLVNTTNIDLGDMHAWDVVDEAKTALAKNDDDHVRKILLASAGIPAVFPARQIGDSLYVDGAVTGNILYGGRTKESLSFPAVWQAAHPDTAVPKMRYWVIFNNQLRFPPHVTEERWPDIMNRAQIMSTQNATVNSMRHLFAQAEISKLKRNAIVEVRVMHVPDDWLPPNENVFDKEVMNNLADLGEKLAADPSNWLTAAP